MYDDLQPHTTGGLLASLTRSHVDSLAELSKSYPQVPSDYVSFLQTLGWGEIGSSAFMLYEGLLAPGQIYADEDDSLAGIVLFGDDLQGYCCGFDTLKGWEVVEIDPVSRTAHAVADSFSSFIRDLLDDLA
ncbi:SMI1/KNR4 family protein [Pseudomonas xantholysinigenes]|uniref:SMI1/KNR4 family protein n=1 Tax=Pseudomonas xantholysinigenes TaxID=2745490 RepID=A0A9E6TVD8_9PSED|nr:SMI1/KNR4 family protein [Pseudomonas xantholysinigenes]QXI37178.1 SMI1/KNR4 family protein [Pseudomonas xantholysinigenes]